MPLNANVEVGFNSLKAFLEENIEKVMNITGYYTSGETNDSAYPNLGLARANGVKNHLVTQGISSTRINTMGELMDELVIKEGVLLGPIEYRLEGESENATEELKALYEKIKADPLVLCFNTAEAFISLEGEQRQKVADISRYLDKVDGATASETGHTDNTGQAAINTKLGLDRTNFAKDYLTQNGIFEAKINVSSKGQTNPIESNATEEGRARNRRTVVTLN